MVLQFARASSRGSVVQAPRLDACSPTWLQQQQPAACARRMRYSRGKRCSSERSCGELRTTCLEAWEPKLQRSGVC